MSKARKTMCKIFRNNDYTRTIGADVKFCCNTLNTVLLQIVCCFPIALLRCKYRVSFHKEVQVLFKQTCLDSKAICSVLGSIQFQVFTMSSRTVGPAETHGVVATSTGQVKGGMTSCCAGYVFRVYNARFRAYF